MKEDQRPREKALRFGLGSLTDQELVALLISSGSKNRDVMKIASDIVDTSDHLAKLFEMNVYDLMQIQGIREVKALQMVAAIELCKRALRVDVYQKKIEHPDDLAEWFEAEYGHLEQEHFVAVYLDTKGKIISHRVLFVGTLNESCMHPRNIFKEAFEKNANAVLVTHNHPSGDPSPSKADLQCTAQLKEVAKMMGVQLLDHIIVGHNAWFSFRQAGYLD